MSLSTQPYKGARDFYPEDKRLQKHLFNTIRTTVERFGYEEYDAPILEPTDLFLAKGNEEIIQSQTYTFTDRGDRSVTVRTEMTPSVSRMVAGRRQELAYPLRWYSIPNLWRYERMQRGRLREFWQLNVDIFGVGGLEADHEIIAVADQILKDFGAKSNMYSICINSRKLMNFIFEEYLGLDEVQAQTIARIIDRIHKISPEEFATQIDAVLTTIQRETGVAEKVVGLMKITKLQDVPSEVQQSPAYGDLVQLMTMLDHSKITNAVFDITIMRGFDYYTDIVFEVMDADPENNRAMLGGGRYDGLVGLFGVEPVPTVGFGLGDVTLQNFLETHDLLPKLQPETELYIVLNDDVYEQTIRVVTDLRNMGVNVAIDSSGRKSDKQLKSAYKKGVHHVLFVGEADINEGRFRIRNLLSGEEQTASIERLVSYIKDYRAK
jgi:histidyl-tRNA synthetase